MIDIIIGASIFTVGAVIGIYLIGNMFSPSRSTPFSGIITTTPKGKLQNLYGANTMSKETTEYDNNEKLAGEALMKCYEYWDSYTKLCKENDYPIPAVVWVQHIENGRMMVFTRGDYAEDLKKFIDNLR